VLNAAPEDLCFDLEKEKGDAAEEVARRWGRLFPARDKSRQAWPVSDSWIAWRPKGARWVVTASEPLRS
jgi:hypothetical protein